MNALGSICLVLISSLLCAYFYVRSCYAYWRRRNVPYIEPRFPYGTLRIKNRNIHHGLINRIYYEQLKGKFPFGGTFSFIRPSVLVTDLDLVQRIAVNDFYHFHDRGFYYNAIDDPLSAHLVNLDGEKWRKTRAKVTPTFSSSKMKFMCETVIGVGEKLRGLLERKACAGGKVEMKDVFAKFTLDVIADVIGIESDSLNESECELLRFAKLDFTEPHTGYLKHIFLRAFPDIGRKLRCKVHRTDVSEYFMRTLKDIVEFREQNGVHRNDFMELLIRLKNDSDPEKSITLNELAANAFLFLLAGYETSSTTLAYAVFELSKHPDCQDKARQCVKQVLDKHEGKVTFEGLQEMNYLDMCINETLRLYPPAVRMPRTVTKEYKVPGTNVVLPKGIVVEIPVFAIHHDPDLYFEPEKFDPERFSPENIASRHPYAFLAFGEGQRVCIGRRFAMMQIKVALASIIKNFEFSLSPGTKNELDFTPNAVLLHAKEELWFNITKV